MRRLGTAVAVLVFVGCALRAHDGHRGVRTELFFGRACPGGTVVDDAAWAAFLAEVVTPRFPNGFTVLDGAGQYREGVDADVTHEQTAVILIVHDDDARSDAAIGAIVDDYKRRFAQRAVLRVDAVVDVSF